MSEWPYNYEGCYCGVKSRRVVFPVPGGGNSSAPADLWHRFSGTESIPGALDARERGLVAAELQALTNQRKEDG